MRIAVLDMIEDSACIYVFERKRKETKLIEKIQGLDKSTIPSDIDKWIVSLHVHKLGFRVLKMPFADRKRVRDTLPLELESLILQNIEDIVYDFKIETQTKKDVNVPVIFVEKTYLKNLVNELKEDGIIPSNITSIDFLGNTFSCADDKLNADERIKIAGSILDRPPINLMRQELVSTHIDPKIEKKLRRFCISLSLLIALILVFQIFKFASYKTEANLIKGQTRKIYKTLFPYERITSPFYQMKAHLKTMQDKNQFIVSVSPLSLLSYLSSIEVEFTEITMRRELITLKGESSSIKSIENIKKKLQAFLEDVKLLKSEAFSDNRFSFTIQAKGMKK